LSFLAPDEGGRPLILLSTPITSQAGERLGLDLMGLDIGPLARLIERPGQFPFPTRIHLVAREPRGGFMALSSPPGPDWSLPPQIQEVVDLAGNDDRPNQIISRDGRVYGVSRVEGADWLLIVDADEADLQAPVTRLTKRTTQIFLMFFAISLLGMWFFALNPLTFEVSRATGALEEVVEETAGLLEREAQNRQKTESRLVLATRRAMMAKQAKSHFLVNLSHEIRTPLNAVIGMTDLALFTELSAEQRSYLTEVKKAAAVLLEQINELLDLSKLEDGLMVTESRKFDLRELLSRLAKVYEAVSREKNLAFNWHLEEGIETRRRGDALRLRQVLNVILDNAFKFTEVGGVDLTVHRARGEAGAARLEFLVQDSGIGIGPERLEYIFDAFSRADNSLTRTTSGSGLGLAVTKRLVELMGGTISVDSKPGRGSLFTVTLDLPPAADAPAEETPLAEAELKGRLAVLADDNEVNRTILKGFLSRLGLEVLAFGGVAATLDFLKNRPEVRPDVFILDYQRPGQIPEELLNRLNNKRPRIPVIFLTSADSSLVRRPDGLKDLRVAWLDNPVDCETLGECLRSVLAGSADQEAKTAAEGKKTAGQLTKTENPRKILVVDDNQLNQKLAATLLAKRGHSTAVAAHGQEALEALDGGGFDVVLMDIQMPVMDGLSAVRHIRAEPEKYGWDLPVVAMTAHALPGDQEAFLKAGMTGYLSKPFNPQDLIAAVEQPFAGRDRAGDNGGKSVALELNRAAILENFMDDEELLFESIDLFLERISARMVELKKAVADKDPEVFMPEAHTIKGMIGIFSTDGAFETARTLEVKGRQKVTDGIDDDFKALENEVGHLVAALRAWRA